MKNLLRRSCTAALSLFVLLAANAQETFPVAAPSDKKPGLYAFTNVTIYTDYKTRVESATLLIKDGKVLAAGQNVALPAGTVVKDCRGKTIYPAFIDMYATGYGLPVAKADATAPAAPPRTGAYAWNESLRPEYDAAGQFTVDAKAAEEWRKLGFGAVLTHRADGIARGTGSLVALADAKEHACIVQGQATQHLSFRKGTSTQAYPSSLMGCVALLRQTYLDADWYKRDVTKTEKNLSMEAWIKAQELPQLFEAGDKLDILRIARLGQEFGLKYIVKTAGDEYQRLDAVKATGYPLVVPLAFPENADVRDPYDALNVPLQDLKHWELAPSNPARLEAAGVTFALTTAGLKDRSKWWEQLRKAIEHGLSEEMALKALTFTPASLLRAYTTLGSLESGKNANFFICSGSVFKAETKIFQTWVNGSGYDVTPEKTMPAPLGDYQLRVGRESFTLTLKGRPEAPEASLMKSDSAKLKPTFTWNNNGLVTLGFTPDTLKKGMVALSGTLGADGGVGSGTLQDGTWAKWTASFLRPAEADTKPTKQNPVTKPETGEVIFPFAAYGRSTPPKAGTVLVRNATVWTNEKEGILQNNDVLFSNGKIAKIGKNLPVQDNALVVDGTGKHLTAGIIDEHSHIAVARSVNEFGQESSAEVRIGDALDSEDIDIYRQLAGGVTSSHLLHGSANPIGGQTQLIKLRWGALPEDLKFQNWPGYIKFALGENVKQGNSPRSTRYPQTRMGVEQVYQDYFTRAQEYGRLQKSGKVYRKDLEMEALLEILEKKRFITCHSYVQSEITMLMRLAEQFGFRVNTFTHILEGYKVADKMAKHGVGGSSFSDWWAYKMEVYEAIPQNAKMMADRGVVVSINSDDAEMARRLNQEAAKSVMYADMAEEDAWKMVTLNPAKLLRVEDRVGSIRSGKDADLVLWNDNPLSIYARAEKTWVDGALYFDRAEDAAQQAKIQVERNRLIQKILAGKKVGEGGEKPAAPKQHYHCDSTEDEG